MATAKLLIGDARTVLATLPDASVDCVITSPPYYRQRAYLADDDPQRAYEIGQESTPGLYLDALLGLMDDLWRVMTADATFWVNLGDKHWGSGGAGGDYAENGLRDGQPKYGPTKGLGGPLDQSACWLPGLFGASLAYGRNLLTGVEHCQWVTRPAVTWCKPTPAPGREGRKFRSATELIIYGGKHAAHYFDLDSVRTMTPEAGQPAMRQANRPVPGQGQRHTRVQADGQLGLKTHALGAPPLNFWVVTNPGFPDAHYATFPEELLVRPIKAGCPVNGTILDPFCGSGTTLIAAISHGRNCIGIDLNRDNEPLIRDRVGMFLEVE